MHHKLQTFMTSSLHLPVSKGQTGEYKTERVKSICRPCQTQNLSIFIETAVIVILFEYTYTVAIIEIYNIKRLEIVMSHLKKSIKGFNRIYKLRSMTNNFNRITSKLLGWNLKLIPLKDLQVGRDNYYQTWVAINTFGNGNYL